MLAAIASLRPPAREAPFWTAAVVWAFLPATKTPWLSIQGVAIDTKHILLLAVAASFALPALRKTARTPRALIPLALGASVVGFAGLSSLLDSSRRGDVTSFWALGFSFAAFFVGWAIPTITPDGDRIQLLKRIALFLALAGLTYFALSFFDLDARSSSSSDFGISRSRGPLWGSATGYFVLTPAIGLAISLTTARAFRPLFGILLSSILTVSMLSLGSRSGFLSLVVLSVLTAVSPGASWRNRVAKILIVSLISLTAFAVVFSRADPDRFRSLEDQARQETYEVGLAYIRHSDIESLILGQGFMAVWRWYERDTRIVDSTGNQYFTAFGRTLYHPHSTVVLVLVELGAIGFASMVLLLLCLFLPGATGRIPQEFSPFAAGLASSALGLFTDTMLFKNWTISAFWWLLLFSSFRIFSPRLGSESKLVPHRF